MTALLPCPFCGGKAEHHDIGNEHTKSRSTKIWCADCCFSKNVGAIRQSLEWTRAKAIEAWNRRHTPSSPVSAPSPAGGVREAELVRAATALMNNLWQDVWSYDRTHEENWKEFDRKYPGMKWLRDARDAALSSPATPEPVSAPATDGEVDQTCTDCGDTGVTYQTERPCVCQPTQVAKVRTGRGAIVHAVASLAAAISLLERTPKAKKAAPSDRMFDQMLKDYRKALDEARTALSNPAPGHGEGGL